MKLKRFKYAIFTFIALALFAELALRIYGLGEWLVYEENEQYEYRIIPNLQITRFGNRISTNSYGMRGSNEPGQKKFSILKIGDSVVNGGSKVDDREVVTTLLSNSLQNQNLNVEVLNISAGSWGPDNAFEFVRNEVDFKYDAMVLVFSGHDYNDNMHHNKVVGKHPSWPSKQPTCAIHDFWVKWLEGKLATIFRVDVGYGDHLKGHDNSRMNDGWKDFLELSIKKDIPILVYVHPELDELKGAKWHDQGAKLIEWLKHENVNYIDGIEKGYSENAYLDNIHLNSVGHQCLASNMEKEIVELCKGFSIEKVDL